jgi:TonB family protein
MLFQRVVVGLYPLDRDRIARVRDARGSRVCACSRVYKALLTLVLRIALHCVVRYCLNGAPQEKLFRHAEFQHRSDWGKDDSPMKRLIIILLVLIAATMPFAAQAQVDPSWQNSLMQQLQRAKHYPVEAQTRTEEGVVLLKFSLDRNGHVLAHSIAQSSGYADLDNEAMGMIIRAEPLPPFPANMTQAQIDLAVPIRFSLGSSAPMSVPMQIEGGIYVVPVLINDAITLDFVVDSGAADVSIPADVVMTLMRTGTLKESDFLGEKTYVLADGSKVPSQTFRIRSLKVGGKVLQNVNGSVASVQGSLLLGQSFLGRFKSWSVDNTKHALLLSE